MRRLAVPLLLATTLALSAEHLEQERLNELVQDGRHDDAFRSAYRAGEQLFLRRDLTGVGAHVGPRTRFTRTPRADLDGPGEWADHVPTRETGPNAAACTSCHSRPAIGAGGTESNVHRDPRHLGDPSSFIQRATPHLFGAGVIQRLAEEMTDSLWDQRDRALEEAARTGLTLEVALTAKEIPFGTLVAHPDGSLDTSGVQGVLADLVVRGYQWKGSVASLREFTNNALHQELGIQSVELVGEGVDGDGDGIVNEASVGEVTALTVFMAAQPVPVRRTTLARLGLERLRGSERQSIRRGERLFADIGCDFCHRQRLRLADPVYREPSLHPAFRQDPVPRGLDTLGAIRIDLSRDQPVNRIRDDGHTLRLGALPRDHEGTYVELLGDMRTWPMGEELAEPIDETGIGADSWLTENLWGVASTGPWLHDGRAVTLTEAILAHGGPVATNSRDAFARLEPREQENLLAYLRDFVLYRRDRSR